jgi:RNase P subunit RPR2
MCPDKEWLHHRYRIAVADYQRAFAVVNARLGTLKQADYEKLRAYIDQARTISENARTALDRHMAEHGC